MFVSLEDVIENLRSSIAAQEGYNLDGFTNEEIINLIIQSKDNNIGYRTSCYSGHLSTGEQEILKKLGYTIKWKSDDGINGDYFRISW